MRFYLVILLSALVLSGCVNDCGMHVHAKPLEVAALSVRHTYPRATSQPCYDAWWKQFKDPTLSKLIQVALSDSPTMQIAKARIEKASYLAKQSKSALWPSIDFSGYLQRERFSTFGLVPPPFNGNTYNIGDLGFNFNYDFDFWGKHRERYAARLSEQAALMADLALSRLVISTAVAETYFQMLGEGEELKLARQQLQQAVAIAELVRARTAHGIESDISLKTAGANVQSLKLIVTQSARSIQLSRNQLAELMGQNPLTTTLLAKPFSFHSRTPRLPHALPAHLLGYRPDIRAARERMEEEAHLVHVARARLFPDINLNALFSYQSVGLGHLFDVQSQNNGITGAIDLPIFDAGERRADVGAHYADYDMAVQVYNQTILAALREVSDKLIILRTLDIEIAQENVALADIKQRYKLFRLRYNHGIIDELPVLGAKSLWLSHQSKLVNLETRRMQAVAALLKALGGRQET